MNNLCKIKTFSFITMDGYVSRMGGELDWLVDYSRANEYGDCRMEEFLDGVDSVVMNAIFYDTLLRYDLWPFGDKPCYVIASRMPEQAQAHDVNIALMESDDSSGFIKAVDSLCGRLGGAMWLVGDHDIVSLFMERGFIDEITINIMPLTIGHGYPLFGHGRAEQRWDLQECRALPGGGVQVRYTAPPIVSQQAATAQEYAQKG